MGNVNNLRIVTELGELVATDINTLNIGLNRIVEDFQDIGNRFGDFSYDFNLPIVKENSIVFGYANAIGNKKVFIKNKNISCQVYLNNTLLLDGIINLEGITLTDYKCKFYSKFKELIDNLNENDGSGKQKTLRSLNFPVVANWKYEQSMIDHINTYGDLDSDSTFYQYPLAFYSTNYCQESYYSGSTDLDGSTFSADRTKQNYYYLLNNIAGNDNRVYIHQIPPAVYIISIIKQILTDAGWKLGGQFFNDSNIKKIVYLYAGDDDIYDQATEIVSGSTELNLQIAKFLPDMSQSEFLQSIINCFNLYFKVDVNNKVLELETYNTYFNNVNPYDISQKVDLNTLNIGYIQNSNPSIVFNKAENQNLFGDNMLMSGSTNNAFTQKWVTGSSKNYNQTFNKVGTQDRIELVFSEPTIKRHVIYNNKNISGTDNSAGMMYFYLPLLSKQTPNDNNNMKFNKKPTDTYVFNNESSIKFNGSGSLMYHYGFPTTTYENKAGDGSLADYLYINIYTGSSILNRVRITICSPWQLSDYRSEIDAWLAGVNPNNIEDRRTSIASYLQSLWQMMGSTAPLTTKLTDFSLVFDDNGYLHNTLWSVFHKNKWDRYSNSEQVEIKMRMNSYDWQEMQIDRSLWFNHELYQLIAIDGYNPIARTALIRMIKI